MASDVPKSSFPLNARSCSVVAPENAFSDLPACSALSALQSVLPGGSERLSIGPAFKGQVDLGPQTHPCHWELFVLCCAHQGRGWQQDEWQGPGEGFPAESILMPPTCHSDSVGKPSKSLQTQRVRVTCSRCSLQCAFWVSCLHHGVHTWHVAGAQLVIAG